MTSVKREPVVIVGAGHAGLHAAATLRQGGYAGPIMLLESQERLPYQRPPLSKAYLVGEMAASELLFRPLEYYEAADIAYLPGQACVAIDREAREATTATGQRLPYDHLILATGADTRHLDIPGQSLEGVCELRIWDDCERLRTAMTSARHAVIVGGGFIGLEAATALAKHGVGVTVIEADRQLMRRSVSETAATCCLRAQEALGVTVLLESMVAGITGKGQRVASVELTSGEALPADLVLVAVGVQPRVELAERGGLDVNGGIVVNEYLETSDPAISAVGDCCSFPAWPGGQAVRLESVQNASDQARQVAARLLGVREAYRDVPWFWSDQGGLKLKMAGVVSDTTEDVIHGSVADQKFSVLRFQQGRLVCGESINSVADHVALRTLVAHGDDLTVSLVSEPDFNLKLAARAYRQ